MDRALVQRPVFEPGRRILAVSDIHGNLPFFEALLKKVHLTKDDILVLNGDILEKGQDSLPLLRRVMELSRKYTVIPVCGNCDGLVYRFFVTDELDGRFFSSYLPRHPESCLRQMAREAGIEQLDSLPKLREDMNRAFPEERDFLASMPTVVETEHLVFVHGGVPSLTGMENLDRWRCMKNDNFLGQGHSFEKWVIVGHWPVTLYSSTIPSAAPLLTRDRRIISIDGGCVLKTDGQLNALVIPSEESEDFSWCAWDGLPVAAALDPQEASEDSINIRWGRSALELLEEGEELSLCRHLESGRVLKILTAYLRRSGDRLWCEDSTDYCLPVAPGDRLHVVRQITGAALCKKDGVTGWYCGRLTEPEPAGFEYSCHPMNPG